MEFWENVPVVPVEFLLSAYDPNKFKLNEIVGGGDA